MAKAGTGVADGYGASGCKSDYAEEGDAEVGVEEHDLVDGWVGLGYEWNGIWVVCKFRGLESLLGGKGVCVGGKLEMWIPDLFYSHRWRGLDCGR